MNPQSVKEKLKKYIPGGCHTYTKGEDQWPSNVPGAIVRGDGCFVWDTEGRRFVDWSMGLTSVAFGHANKEINAAAIEAMGFGQNFQRPSLMEAEAAEQFVNFLGDRGDMVKFSKNGSTVTTAAVKLSRAYTGRDLIGICREHPFFSYDDWFIGSTRCPDGVPDAIRKLTTKFSYNNIQSVQDMFDTHKNQIACVIVEPVKFDKPENDFLNSLSQICKENGAILIFDEMVTGFKWHAKGAAKYYGASADLYTWGKGLANGHSVCALTGSRDIMELGGIDHDKPRVFLTSTTHGAEIPQLGALLKVLDMIKNDPLIFERNWHKGRLIKSELVSIFKAAGVSDYLGLSGEDCFFLCTVKNSLHHKSNVARTYLLQELIREGQLSQGLFYPTIAHTDEALEMTFKAWRLAAQRFKNFVEGHNPELLIGPATRPVFRTYNDCECLTSEDCGSCMQRVQESRATVRDFLKENSCQVQ